MPSSLLKLKVQRGIRTGTSITHRCQKTLQTLRESNCSGLVTNGCDLHVCVSLKTHCPSKMSESIRAWEPNPKTTIDSKPCLTCERERPSDHWIRILAELLCREACCALTRLAVFGPVECNPTARPTGAQHVPEPLDTSRSTCRRLASASLN